MFITQKRILFLSIIFAQYMIRAADRNIPDISIGEIRALTAPDNLQTLIERIKSTPILSSWTKDALLSHALLQHNLNAVIPLLEAGASASPWVIEEVLGQLDLSNPNISPEERKNRMEAFIQIRGVFLEAARKQSTR